MASNAELVAQVYIGFYDRAPDPVGLQYWIGRLVVHIVGGAVITDADIVFA